MSEAFGPSKFVGYRGTTIGNYDGSGDGGITNARLSRYFTRLTTGDDRYVPLREKLNAFLAKLDAPLSKRFYSAKSPGGIYVPMASNDLRHEIHGLGTVIEAGGDEGSGYSSMTLPEDAIIWMGIVSMMEGALQRVRSRGFPVVIGVLEGTEVVPRAVRDPRELLNVCEETCRSARKYVAEHRHKRPVKACASPSMALAKDRRQHAEA